MSQIANLVYAQTLRIEAAAWRKLAVEVYERRRARQPQAEPEGERTFASIAAEVYQQRRRPGAP